MPSTERPPSGVSRAWSHQTHGIAFLMSNENGSSIVAAFRQIPCGLFILTTTHNDIRSGVLAKWVQPCSLNPPLVMVAIAQGLPVEPLMRDSRCFALCQISAGDALLRRLFADPPGRDEDPFFSLPARRARSGAPILDRALSYLDCEIVRHVDLDTDYRLYVGQVIDGAVLHSDAEPAVEVGGGIHPPLYLRSDSDQRRGA